MSQYRTDLQSWLLDHLDFVVEQIDSARAPSDRLAAIDAARHGIIRIMSRLPENELVAAYFALLFYDFTSSPFWQDNWIGIAKGPSQDFQEFADNLIGRCRVAKTVFEQILSSPQSD